MEIIMRRHKNTLKNITTLYIWKFKIGYVWTPGYTPADRLTSWGVLHYPCTVPVYKLLYISQ